MIDINSDQGQVLIGTTFGDGCLQNHWRKKTATLALNHCVAQKEYVEWKSAMLNLRGLKISKNRKGDKYSGASHRLEELYPFWKTFYPNGKKIVPLEYLRALKPLGLAVWYCDDGSYQYWVNTLSLHTQGFLKEGNELIKTFFEETWNLRCTIIEQNIEGYDPYYYLCFNNDSTRRLLEIVKPHILKTKCMRYKLGPLLKENMPRVMEARKKRREYRKERYWKNRDKILENQRKRRLLKGMKPKPYWTEDELDYLKENYQALMDKEIASELNRSKQAVTMKRLRMGLRKK